MCSITLIAIDTTMATTEVTRNADHGILMPWLPQQENNLRMNWVVVTANNGRLMLHPQWKSGAMRI